MMDLIPNVVNCQSRVQTAIGKELLTKIYTMEFLTNCHPIMIMMMITMIIMISSIMCCVNKSCGRIKKIESTIYINISIINEKI